MDIDKMKVSVQKIFSKEKSVKLLIILGICGIAMIYLSTLFDSDEKVATETQPAPQFSTADCERRLEQELSRIVSAITGEESPAVLVTLESTGETVYAADERTESSESRAESETSHIILKGSDGGQQALTVTEIQPNVKGVVIVSSRAGDPIVREKLTDAVKTALDISSARVCVTDSG